MMPFNMKHRERQRNWPVNTTSASACVEVMIN